MVERQPINKHKYLAAFSFTALIFIIGILVGLQFSNYTTSKFQIEQDLLKIQLTSLDLKNELVKTNLCNLDWNSIWKDKVNLGNRIESLESSQGKDNSNVLIQKEFYQLVQIRTWLLLKDLKENCVSANQSIILFFYTNQENDPNRDLSDRQGIVLDELYSRYQNKIAIFSFDINIDNTALDTLKSSYNIKSAPTLVINEKDYEGFKSSKELEAILNR